MPNPKKQKSKKKGEMAASAETPSFVSSLIQVVVGSGSSTKHTLSLKPYIQSLEVEDLLMWRNVMKTGVVFGAISIAYFVLALSGFGFFFILINLLLIGVLGMLLWNRFGATLKYPPPALPPYLENGVTEKEIQQFSEQHLDTINKALSTVYTLASGSDAILSGKSVIALFLVARISALISPFTLAYLCAFFAFTGPKFYEIRKDEIDVVWADVSVYFQQIYDMINEKVLSKIPTAKKVD
eukprot:TRINITY_DN383_c1_g1_i1.p3 TRINITY_DN383_c1_g1~~TRINITY_DN383_c1_g1_i1.p3  ORF type:complete len:275 (+),score=24.76 TRINITY_DN383_c1_g1_i1:106-825(+)